MRKLRMLVSIVVFFSGALQSYAQGDKQDDERRKIWVKANLTTKQDAIDFITMTYKDFTILITKRSVESGVYKREIKYNDCELTIETDSREQESSWKSDKEFVKDIVVIDLDRVMLDGNDIKPSSPENAKGLFAGKSYAHFHKIPSYSILAGAPNRDNEKFTDKHYEEHLQWAFQFLIEQCSNHGN